MPTLREILRPSVTAVLVVDVQNDFCSPDGGTAKAGRSVEPCVEMVPRLVNFLDASRRYGVRVIFVQAIGSHWTESETWMTRTSDVPRRSQCREGTWGAEFYGVQPASDELVVAKHRNNAFHNTRLETALRALDVRTLVMTGVATNISVETTARDAVQRDYHVVLVEDCCAAYEPAAHDATMYNIRNFFGRVASGDAVCAIWSDYAREAAGRR